MTLPPVLAGTFANYGSALLARKEYEEAAEQFRRALEIDAAGLEAQLGLGTALTRLGRPEEAIEAYLQAIEHHPEEAAAPAYQASSAVHMSPSPPQAPAPAAHRISRPPPGIPWTPPPAPRAAKRASRYRSLGAGGGPPRQDPE